MTLFWKKWPTPDSQAIFEEQVQKIDMWWATHRDCPPALRKFYVRMALAHHDRGSFDFRYVPAFKYPEVFCGLSLTAHLYDWYFRTYGWRLFRAPLQQMLVRGVGQLCPLRVSSSGVLLLSDEHQHPKIRMGVDLLSRGEQLPWRGLLALRTLPLAPLAYSLIGDYETSVFHLSSERLQIGLARWHMMQVMEKLLKLYLRAAVPAMTDAALKSFNHNLLVVLEKCVEHGLSASAELRSYIKKLECSAGVRYPMDERPELNPGHACDTAFRAHLALLSACEKVVPQVRSALEKATHLGKWKDDALARPMVEHHQWYACLEEEEHIRMAAEGRVGPLSNVRWTL